MPSTSEVRRAARTSVRFLQFPPAARPPHLPPSPSRRRLGLAREASAALEPLVPPAWPEPWHPARASVHLLGWTRGLGDLISDSSASIEHEEALCAADDAMIDRMNTWLRGEWSSREALIEMLWRLEVGDRCVAAALWLHDLVVASGTWPRER